MSTTNPKVSLPPSQPSPTILSPVPTATQPPKQNPALRALGLPRLRLRLPSRNWLIFLTITGSLTSAIGYDRYHKRVIQRKWCDSVSHLASEPLPIRTLPRQIRVFLCAAPGDGLGPARAHFREYVQPILTAAALDWELVEGRAEGELMCKWAGEIRGKRRRLGEVDSSVEKAALTEAELYRLREGISAQEGVGGDLIIGRNTWKEYIRGLHAGWLGPLEDPASSRVVPSPEPAMVEDQSSTGVETSSQEPAPPATPSEPEAPPPRQELAEDQYESSTPSQVIPSTLDPALPIPYPHILGFLNTPTRIRRFLTKRRLADDVGRQVAAVCLGQLSDDSTASWNEHQSAEEEARGLLEHEESDWPKKYRQPAPDAEGEVPKDHIWSKAMILDPRLSSRLRFFAPNFPDDPTTGTGSDG